MGCAPSQQLHEENMHSSFTAPSKLKLPKIPVNTRRSLSHSAATSAAALSASAVQLHSPTESRPNSTHQLWMQQQLQHQQQLSARGSPDTRNLPRISNKHSPPGLTSDIQGPISRMHHSRPRPIRIHHRLPGLPHQEHLIATSNDATPTFPAQSPCSTYHPTEVEITVGQPEIPVEVTPTSEMPEKQQKQKSHRIAQITVQAADGSAEPDVIPIQDADSYAKMYFMYSDSLPEYQEYKKNWESEQEKFKQELALKERGVFRSPSRSIFTPEESRCGTPASPHQQRTPVVSSPVPGGQLIANGTALCIMIENSRPASVASSPIPGYKIAFDNHSLIPGSPSSMVLADHPELLNPISPGVATPKLSSSSHEGSEMESLRVPHRISFHHNLHVPHHQPHPHMYTLREQNEPTEMDWRNVESRLNRLIESSA